MNTERNSFLIAGSRTPIGDYRGGLNGISTIDLTVHVFNNALRKAGIAGRQLDGIFVGNKYQSCSDSVNLARLAARKTGIPDNVPAMTVQVECGSGMAAIHQAMVNIASGKGDIYLVGGTESMSTVPYTLSGKNRNNWLMKKLPKFAPLFLFNASARRMKWLKVAEDGMAPYHLQRDPVTLAMMYTAQLVADKYNVSRLEMDEYSLLSHQLAIAAIDSGRFNLEIDPIITNRKLFAQDEHPRRDTSLRALGKLRAQQKTMAITAGNSSGVNDGACALVVVSGEMLNKLGLEPLAKLNDWDLIGYDPLEMGVGPAIIAKKILSRNALSVSDIGIWEINEAFAAQTVACQKLLGIDREKLNVNGGGISLGHPIGMSGARVVLTAAHEMKLRKVRYGLASACVGGGHGIGTLLENTAL